MTFSNLNNESLLRCFEGTDHIMDARTGHGNGIQHPGDPGSAPAVPGFNLREVERTGDNHENIIRKLLYPSPPDAGTPNARGTLLDLPVPKITGQFEETTGKVTLDLLEAAKKIMAGQFHLDPPPTPTPDPLPPIIPGWPVPEPPTDWPSEPAGDYPEPSGGGGGNGAGDGGGGIDPHGTDDGERMD